MHQSHAARYLCQPRLPTCSDIPDPDMNPLVEEWIRMKRDEAGGTLALAPGAPLELRIFLDGSCLEIFTGKALTGAWRGPCSTWCMEPESQYISTSVHGCWVLGFAAILNCTFMDFFS